MFSNINNLIVLKNAPLNKHSSFKIGGETKYFLKPYSVDCLLDVLYVCNQHSIPHKIIGGGSNLLFDDNGFDGAIIQYLNNSTLYKNDILFAGSGCTIAQLIQFSIENNLSGFEFAIGVPAMLGGAIVNNLGAYSVDISTNLTHVTALCNNQLVHYKKEDCSFAYHCSKFQSSNYIILSANFALPYQSADVTRTRAREFLVKRTNSQPLHYPNAGSIFKRNADIVPAKLIQDANLKGTRIGDAQISIKHSGFIVNLGHATSKDVLTLIKLIQEKIYNLYNIALELEIEYVPSTL